MRFATRIGLALLVVASMGVVVGSSGFSSTEADRSVSVTIVEDESAYVGLDYDPNVTAVMRGNTSESGQDATSFNATHESAAVVENRFTEDITITVTVLDEEGEPGIEFENEDGGGNDAEIPVGEDAVFDAVISCSGKPPDYPSRNVTVEYHAEGPTVTATIEREITVRCEKGTDSNAGNSNGSGQGETDSNHS